MAVKFCLRVTSVRRSRTGSVGSKIWHLQEGHTVSWACSPRQPGGMGTYQQSWNSIAVVSVEQSGALGVSESLCAACRDKLFSRARGHPTPGGGGAFRPRPAPATAPAPIASQLPAHPLPIRHPGRPRVSRMLRARPELSLYVPSWCIQQVGKVCAGHLC